MKTAMILAAGRGDRLKPLTELIPKALCKIRDVPLIEHHVIKLSRANFKQVIINHAYLGGQIRQHLGDGQRFGIKISYTPEPPGGLETGGGIFNALPLLGSDPFITINADIYTDYDFASLRLPSNQLAHIVLAPKPEYAMIGDFGLDEHQRVHHLDHSYTFCGIACYDPHLFTNHQPGRYSMGPILRRLAEQQKLTGELYSGKWFDIGSLARLELANRPEALC